VHTCVSLIWRAAAAADTEEGVVGGTGCACACFCISVYAFGSEEVPSRPSGSIRSQGAGGRLCRHKFQLLLVHIR
jgi:hypothetical protein